MTANGFQRLKGNTVTPAEFKRWRKWMGLSQKEAASALGLKRRVVQYYEKGERDGEAVNVPRSVYLACYALAAGVTSYCGPTEEEALALQEVRAKEKKERKARDKAQKRRERAELAAVEADLAARGETGTTGSTNSIEPTPAISTPKASEEASAQKAG